MSLNIFFIYTFFDKVMYTKNISIIHVIMNKKYPNGYINCIAIPLMFKEDKVIITKNKVHVLLQP